jgi:hypothetical protein
VELPSLSPRIGLGTSVSEYQSHNVHMGLTDWAFSHCDDDSCAHRPNSVEDLYYLYNYKRKPRTKGRRFGFEHALLTLQ